MLACVYYPLRDGLDRLLGSALTYEWLRDLILTQSGTHQVGCLLIPTQTIGRILVCFCIGFGITMLLILEIIQYNYRSLRG